MKQACRWIGDRFLDAGSTPALSTRNGVDYETKDGEC